MQLGLLVKCALAFISGVACWWVPDTLGISGEIFPLLAFFVVSGLLFALGVLFPYLRRDRSIMWKGTALVAISALSYWCAMSVAGQLISPWAEPHEEDFVAASLVGALIVLAGAKVVIPLNRPVQLAVTGFFAAVIGGLLFSGTSPDQEYEEFYVLAYGAWHLLMAAAIHFGALPDWRVSELFGYFGSRR